MRQKGVILLPIVIIIVLLGALGYFIFQNSQLRNNYIIPTSPFISPTIHPTMGSQGHTPPSDTKEKWEVYVSDSYKYEIKYPKDIFKGQFFVFENGKHVNITNEKNKKLLELNRNIGLQFFIGIREDTTSLGDYNPNWQKHFNELNLLKIDQEKEQVKKIDEKEVDGTTVGIFLEESHTDTQIYRLFTFFKSGQKLIEISLNAFNINVLISNTDLFYQILSTFKFIQ